MRAEPVQRGPVLRVELLHAAECGLGREPVFILQPLVSCVVLARKEVRHPMPVGPAILGEGRRVAHLVRHAGRGIVRVGRGVDVRLVHVDGIVDDGDHVQEIAMSRDELGHRVHVARLRSATLEVAILQVRRRDLQRVPDPLSGRKARPAVWRPCRWVRTAVHEDRTVQRPHELDVIRPDVARQRILFLEDARPAKPAPLMWGRVRPALVFRRSPDRFRRGIGPQTPGLVEGDARIVAERRLGRGVVLVVLEAPFAGDVRRVHRPCGLCGRGDTGHHRERDEEPERHDASLIAVGHIAPEEPA